MTSETWTVKPVVASSDGLIARSPSGAGFAVRVLADRLAATDLERIIPNPFRDQL